VTNRNYSICPPDDYFAVFSSGGYVQLDINYVLTASTDGVFTAWFTGTCRAWFLFPVGVSTEFSITGSSPFVLPVNEASDIIGFYAEDTSSCAIDAVKLEETPPTDTPVPPTDTPTLAPPTDTPTPAPPTATASNTPVFVDGVTGADMAYYLNFLDGLDLIVAFFLAMALVGAFIAFLVDLLR